MSTKPDTDTGWSKEAGDLVSRTAVNKILYDGYRDHLHHCTNSVNAAQFVHGLQKAVTALPSSDFEQLIRLRKAANDALIFMRRWFGEHAPRQLPGDQELITALREALAPTGEQS